MTKVEIKSTEQVNTTFRMVPRGSYFWTGGVMYCRPVNCEDTQAFQVNSGRMTRLNMESMCTIIKNLKMETS